MIGVIYAGQVELSPFVKRYTSVMDGENIPYEIIHWNRSGEKMPDDDKRHTYFAHVERYGRLIGKAAPFWGFRKFALGIIKEKKYDCTDDTDRVYDTGAVARKIQKQILF